MKGKLIRSYSKLDKNGKAIVVFVYALACSIAQIASLKEAQGDFYREVEEGDDAGKPLFFTTRAAGNNCTVIITPSGKVIADMSAFQMQASLAEQFGGNLGQALANAAAATLLGGGAPVAESAPVAVTAAQDGDPELGDH